MPEIPVRDQWEYPRKMERHFSINLEIPFFIPFPNSLRKWREVAQWTLLSKWNGKFRSETAEGDMGTTFRGDPEYFGRKEPKLFFSSDFGRIEISGVFDIMESALNVPFKMLATNPPKWGLLNCTNYIGINFYAWTPVIQCWQFLCVDDHIFWGWQQIQAKCQN